MQTGHQPAAMLDVSSFWKQTDAQQSTIACSWKNVRVAPASGSSTPGALEVAGVITLESSYSQTVVVQVVIVIVLVFRLD